MERHAVDLEALRGERSPPKRRRDCPPLPELCPFIECRYHLWTDRVHRGRVMILAASSAYGDPAHFCALHEADQGPKTLEQVGVVYGVSRERIRQLEAESMAVLRAVNPSLLRELLSVVDDISCETEPPCDDPDDGAVAPRTATAQPPLEDACDSTSSAADVCDLVSDQTEASPWCEPTSTDPRVQAINEKKVARATARAANAKPYWCPHCGRTYPGIGIEGNACPTDGTQALGTRTCCRRGSRSRLPTWGAWVQGTRTRAPPARADRRSDPAAGHEGGRIMLFTPRNTPLPTPPLPTGGSLLAVRGGAGAFWRDCSPCEAVETLIAGSGSRIGRRGPGANGALEVAHGR